jgi:hypothetical protein
LGTDTVQCKGESKSQGGFAGAIDVESRMLTGYEWQTIPSDREIYEWQIKSGRYKSDDDL